MQEVFLEVGGQFKNPHDYESYIQKTEAELEIKIYRLKHFKANYAKGVYGDLQKKYRQGQLPLEPTKWHENQRRLYVWFLVSYIRLKSLNPFNLRQPGNQRHWKVFSQVFFQKQVLFLQYQYLNLLKLNSRVQWDANEDEKLKISYEIHSKGEWNEMAKYLFFQSKGEFFKTPKQCRERWQNHLDRKVKKGDWTTDEDLTIFTFVRKYGKKWARITSILKFSRTEHMIKNRFKSLLNKKIAQKKITQDRAIQQIFQNLTTSKNYCSLSMCMRNSYKQKEPSKQTIDISEIKKENKDFECQYFDSEQVGPEQGANQITLPKYSRPLITPRHAFASQSNLHYSKFQFNDSVRIVCPQIDISMFQQQQDLDVKIVDGCKIETHGAKGLPIKGFSFPSTDDVFRQSWYSNSVRSNKSIGVPLVCLTSEYFYSSQRSQKSQHSQQHLQKQNDVKMIDIWMKEQQRNRLEEKSFSFNP